MNIGKRTSLAALGMMLGGMFGRFGDLEPRKDYAGIQIEGSAPARSRWPASKKQAGRARSGHGKGHRRRMWKVTSLASLCYVKVR